MLVGPQQLPLGEQVAQQRSSNLVKSDDDRNPLVEAGNPRNKWLQRENSFDEKIGTPH